MKKGVPNVTAHLSLFLSLLLPFIRAILHHTDNHDFFGNAQSNLVFILLNRTFVVQ